MSLYSNHQPEVVAEANGPEDDMGHEACGQAFPDEPTQADWEEYGRWSEALDRQMPPAEPKPSTNGKPARKPRAKRRRTFTITFAIGGTDYRVYPLAIDPAVGVKAWRFSKQGGDGEVYDLHPDAFGLHCQCRGFEAHGHCKHMETVQATAKVFCLK
jgi:hypothetical protein